MKLISLSMIVRDEVAVIERCLSSVKPFIDYWVIVDTGSEDSTPDLIRSSLADIPGELHHREWKNFGHNRTEALELAKDKGDYLLFIDADEQLVAEPGATWPELKGAAYSLEARFSELSYDRLSLVSTRYPWRWEGVVHEYPTIGHPVDQPRISGFWIKVTPDGARSRDPDKFKKDAEALLAALRDEPNNERYVFYLAQSYRDGGQFELARRYYDQRASMGGWEEEVWHSILQCARISEWTGATHGEIVGGYLNAYENRPVRAEPLVYLAAYCRSRHDWHSGYLFAKEASKIPIPKDRLFVDILAYQWKTADELALAAFYTGRIDEATKLWLDLLANPSVPEPDRLRIQGNLKFVQ